MSRRMSECVPNCVRVCWMTSGWVLLSCGHAVRACYFLSAMTSYRRQVCLCVVVVLFSCV